MNCTAQKFLILESPLQSYMTSPLLPSYLFTKPIILIYFIVVVLSGYSKPETSGSHNIIGYETV